MAAITKKFLHDAYVRSRLSTWAIANKFKLPRSSVYTSLKRYGIAIRNPAQAHIRYHRKSFGGDPLEKAYLIGFSIGDLRVRRHNGRRSDTISIGCGSTKQAQIKLINALFSAYGRVWKGVPDKRGAVNIEAFVDTSFHFLLPDSRDYRWCAKSKKIFFSFLAGFTDAEGSWFVSRGKAFLAWGNYDSSLLLFLRTSLKKFDIVTPPVRHDSLKGYVGSHGYARKKNYYHLSCTRKDMLIKLVRELYPLTRHADKRKRLAIVRKNLIMRGVTV